MKRVLKKIFSVLGLEVHRARQNDLVDVSSFDAFKMQQHLTEKISKNPIIFDVGAYDGSTTSIYRQLFPFSKIFCFEPFPNSFDKLQKKLSSFPNTHLVNKALGEKEGIAKFNSNIFPPTNSLLETHELGSSIWGKEMLDTIETINIETTTLDNFVEANRIEKIDILKMDVQGAEHLVLQGAKKSLERGIINLVYTEVILLPTYKGQLEFDEIIKLMRVSGFKIFGIYNQSSTSHGELRQVDIIFLKSKIY